MVKNNNGNGWIEFNANARNRNGDEKSIRLTKSGYLAVSPKVYVELLGEPHRVRLFYKEDDSTRQIGICRAGDDDKGLRVFQIGGSKSRYMSARRFIRDFKINFSETLLLKCDFDSRQQMVIADLPASLGVDTQKIVLSSDGSPSRREEFKKINEKIVNYCDTPKSTSEIVRMLKNDTSKPGKRWGPRQSSKFERMVSNRLRNLVGEDRIKVVPKPDSLNSRENAYQKIQLV